MRYTINTTDNEGIIGIQINKWEKEGKLSIIEKSETLIEIENKLAKVHVALETLKKAGYNSRVMLIYLHEETKLPYKDIHKVLSEQQSFLKQIGALK